MKVLLINTFERLGGAARATGRLQKGLRAAGIESRLLVSFKESEDPDVICGGNPLRRLARRLKVFVGTLPVRRYPNRPENNFTPALLPDHLIAEIDDFDPDIVHLNWLGAGFFKVETLARIKKPVVWTLHDSWAFTGGCHVPFSCTRYRQSCGACPVLGSANEGDLSRKTWERKSRSWNDLDPTLVTPSGWLADCARSSSLFKNARIEVLPNGLDTDAFQPIDKKKARYQLGLPMERKLILFGAVRVTRDRNKGFHLLQPALKALGAGASNTGLLVFGSRDPGVKFEPGLPAEYLGEIDNDETLATIYSAADVFVSPSLQENLPNTIMEAMSCGTPCVAFAQGGVPEMIEHERTGYLAKPFDTGDFAHGIQWILSDQERWTEISLKARAKARSHYDISKVASRYVTIYRNILNAQETEKNEESE